jgi:hypothetical protein
MWFSYLDTFDYFQILFLWFIRLAQSSVHSFFFFHFFFFNILIIFVSIWSILSTYTPYWGKTFLNTPLNASWITSFSVQLVEQAHSPALCDNQALVTPIHYWFPTLGSRLLPMKQSLLCQVLKGNFLKLLGVLAAQLSFLYYSVL